MAQSDLGDRDERGSVPATRVASWKPLELNEANVNHFWLGLSHLPVVLQDVFGGDKSSFMEMLLRPRNVFFEVGNGDGIVCCLNLEPKLKAEVYPIMFDKHLKGREELFGEICGYLFKLLQLERITSIVSRDCETTIKFLIRCGFDIEGMLKNAVRRDYGLVDQAILGFVREGS